MTQQILPVTPVRNKEGYWTHPQYPSFEEGTTSVDVERAFCAAGVTSWVNTEMQLELEINHPAYVRYFDKGEADIHDWNPTQPEGDGWFLLSIHDTDEGPVAVFGCRAESIQPVMA